METKNPKASGCPTETPKKKTEESNYQATTLQTLMRVKYFSKGKYCNIYTEF